MVRIIFDQCHSPKLCSKFNLGSQNDFEPNQISAISAFLAEPHLIAERQLLFSQFHTPAETLSDRKPILAQLACKLKGDSVELRATFCVYAQAGCQFRDYGPKVARL